MKTSFVSIALVLGLAGTALAAGVSFSARDGWVRAAPEGARALAGYVQLANEGEQTLRIVDASSAAFEAVAFHESYEDEGMARMRAVGALEIPAKGSLSLAPGGLHLMLLRPTRPIAEGANIVVDLLTEEGDPLPVVLQVRRGPAETGHEHHGH
jgi:copper(I)-binding protein